MWRLFFLTRKGFLLKQQRFKLHNSTIKLVHLFAIYIGKGSSFLQQMTAVVLSNMGQVQPGQKSMNYVTDVFDFNFCCTLKPELPY